MFEQNRLWVGTQKVRKKKKCVPVFYKPSKEYSKKVHKYTFYLSHL